jgi:hypothetical protein
MKYKNKEFKKVNLYVTDQLDGQIFSLNKKYKRLADITAKYFENSEELDFEKVKDAFISKSDPNILMQKNKDFVEEYLKEVIRIRNEYSLTQLNVNMQIDLAANDVELQRKRISKTMLELDK